MSEGFSDQDVDLVATALMREMLGDDLPAADRSGPGWALARSEARAVLTALAAAGLLLPEGAVLETDFEVRWHFGDGTFKEWGCESLEGAHRLVLSPPVTAFRGAVRHEIRRCDHVAVWSVVEPASAEGSTGCTS